MTCKCKHILNNKSCFQPTPTQHCYHSEKRQQWPFCRGNNSFNVFIAKPVKEYLMYTGSEAVLYAESSMGHQVLCQTGNMTDQYKLKYLYFSLKMAKCATYLYTLWKTLLLTFRHILKGLKFNNILVYGA